MVDKWCSHCTTTHHHQNQLHEHDQAMHPLPTHQPPPSRFRTAATSFVRQPYAFLLERLNWSRTSAERSATSVPPKPNPSNMSAQPLGRFEDDSSNACFEYMDSRTSVPCSGSDYPDHTPVLTAGSLPETEIDEKSSSRFCSSNPATHLKRTRKREQFAPSVWSATLLTPVLIAVTLFAICVMNPIAGVHAGTELITHRPNAKHAPPMDQGPDANGVCSSRDVRNFANSTKQLENCTVIEGFLIITLINNFDELDQNKIHFPKLVEITDYLLIFQVKNLRTLANLFPNLRVIRGNTLVKNFALIIFENFQMHEVGLPSLTYIARGNVRISGNPLLCFADNINWAAIAPNTLHTDHIMIGNKKDNECPVCPSGGRNVTDPTIVELNCPVSPVDPKKRLCWNQKNCQKICPVQCGTAACNDDGACCDASCVSGCSSKPGSDKLDVCVLCRNLVLITGNERKCVDTCPEGYFNYNDYRCITGSECRNRTLPFSVSSSDLNRMPFIPFAGMCSMSCPLNYMIKITNNTRYCEKCDGPCTKSCNSGTIDSISTAQKFRGCNRIDGNLLIQIRNQGGLNVVKELVTALSDLEEITGTLKIVRSVSIVSLSFFKRLTRIGGELMNEDSGRYALYVMDNQNLQELFPNNVTIEKGKLFFHFNPKLCYANILKLVPNVVDLGNVTTPPLEEVAMNSNGDKVACNIKILRAMATDISDVAAILLCEAMKFPDERVLLGYVLHVIPTLYRNVTYYDGRDGCGVDGWRVEDIAPEKSKGTHFNVLMSRLTPYTQYAYYIRTYTIASQMDGGQTEIQYLTTNPSKPDPVARIQAEALSDTEISVSWSANTNFKGKPRAFVITATITEEDPQILDQRNYCDHPLGALEPARKIVEPSPPPETNDTAKCDCSNSTVTLNGDAPAKIIPDEESTLQNIEFENAVQNAIFVRRVYVKKGDAVPKGVEMANSPLSRRRRQMMISGNETASNTKEIASDYPPHLFPDGTGDKKAILDDPNSRMEGKVYVYFYMEVAPNVTHVLLKDLRHFSQYTINVKACREGYEETCGKFKHVDAMTRKHESADIVPSVAVEQLSGSNYTAGSVLLKWPVPQVSNRMIVSYTVRYQRVDLEHSTGTDMCITHTMYTNKSREYIIKSLENGNYSFTVMAISFAGPGPWSPPSYILISSSGMTLWQWFWAIIGTIFAIALVAGASFALFRWRYGGRNPNDLKLIASVNPEYVSMQYTPDSWERARDQVTLIRELGQGSFGMVYQGTLRESDTVVYDCAIKTVNENATDRERINFLKEAAVMKAFNTHHVVRLLGVVSNGQPTLVVMELMTMGDLKGFLRHHRPEEGGTQAPTLKQILQMAIEIADGMAYLSAKKFVHRDLAARNCMVASDMTVKIGDFGMTRDIYETDYYRKGTKGLLPVRWMSPESLKDGIFSTSSDVFSYGVVLWEMATLASQPYQGLSNDQVLKYVIDGGVMERPENCPEVLYKMMCKSWQHRPSSRPSFLQIVHMLLEHAHPDFRKVSFFHTTDGQDLLNYRQRKVVDDATTPLRAEEEDCSVGTVADHQNAEEQRFFVDGQAHEAGDGSQRVTLAHSPLRSSVFGLRRLTAGSIPDIATSPPKNNRNSPVSIVTASLASNNNIQLPSSGRSNNVGAGSINRGIEFLRNAFFGYVSPGTSGGTAAAAHTDLPQYTVQTHHDTSNGSSNGSSHELPMRTFATPEHEHFIHTVDPNRHLPAADWRAPIHSSTPIDPAGLSKYAKPSATSTTLNSKLPRNGFRLPVTAIANSQQQQPTSGAKHLTQPLAARLQTPSITTTSHES